MLCVLPCPSCGREGVAYRRRKLGRWLRRDGSHVPFDSVGARALGLANKDDYCRA